MAENELFQKKKYKIRYAASNGGGCTVTLPFNPRKGICECCGKSIHKIDSDGKPEIKLTQLHHWMYAHTPEAVKKNPLLVLDNTVEVCFTCHQVADGLRAITKLNDINRVVAVMVKMPKPLLDKMYNICSLYKAWYDKNEKV